ncbi:MAG TPA: helix-turn-helix transcriptional regulator [bacterium]|nr:helix-turn-helix transcriptional regulator [bacterium]
MRPKPRTTDSYADGKIGSVLARLIRDRGVSVRALGMATGITRGAIHTWLPAPGFPEGKCEPRFKAVCALADALGVPIEVFRHREPADVAEFDPVGEFADMAV